MKKRSLILASAIATLSVAGLVCIDVVDSSAPNDALLAASREHGRKIGQHLAQLSASPICAGVAETRVELPANSPLGGYAQLCSRHSVEVGKIVASALVLRNKDTGLVITGLDAVTVSADLWRLVAAADTDGLRTIMTASHTHSGPGGYANSWLDSLFLGPYDETILHTLAQALLQARQQALADCSPSQLGYSSVDAVGLVVPRAIGTDPIDTTLDMLTLSRQGQKIGQLFALGAHATLVRERDRLDGDYPAQFRSALQEHFGEKLVVLFAAAATGSVSAARLEKEDPAHALGRALAQRVINMDPLQPQASALALGAERCHLDMGKAQVPLGTWFSLATFISQRIVPQTLPVDIARIGRIILVAIPGELSSETSLQMRRSFFNAGWNIFFVAHNGAYGGYFLPIQRFRGPGPEAALELYGAGSAEVFAAFLTALLQALGTAS